MYHSQRRVTSSQGSQRRFVGNNTRKKSVNNYILQSFTFMQSYNAQQKLNTLLPYSTN